MAGVLLGSVLGERASGQRLTRWFAVLVVVVAVYTATESVLRLA